MVDSIKRQQCNWIFSYQADSIYNIEKREVKREHSNSKLLKMYRIMIRNSHLQLASHNSRLPLVILVARPWPKCRSVHASLLRLLHSPSLEDRLLASRYNPQGRLRISLAFHSNFNLAHQRQMVILDKPSSDKNNPSRTQSHSLR